MPRILVVDDEPRMLLLLNGLLSSNNYEVSTAIDGLEALELLGQKAFDVVLTDVKMPNMDGYELFRKIREVPIRVPVIFLTAFGTAEGELEAMRCGASSYMSKPFRVNELLEAIGRAVEQGTGGARMAAP